MESQNQDQNQFWLQTTFQNTIEVSLQYMVMAAPQQTPYVHKYKAINMLKALCNRVQPYNFIPHCLLGQLYSEVEQTGDSFRSYENALLELSRLPGWQVLSFSSYFITVYNMLGLAFINRDQNQYGLGCLGKAHDIYLSFKKASPQNVYHNRSQQPKGRAFRCFYRGGTNHEQINDSHTLTLFYLAQAYTKLGLKSQSAEYCGRTLQRQYATNKFQLNQFCHNLIGLSQYYQGNRFYAQAQYLLMLGLEVLPEGKKAKMRATLQMALANCLSDLLSYSCQSLKGKNLKQGDNEAVNRQLLLFQNFEQKFPKVQLPKNIEECKSIFRQANTQLKKAGKVYVLDGFVTQYVEICFAQSKLYKSLSTIQKSRERIFSMLEKRRELLEPLLKELNQKAFPATWQRILVEVSQISNDLFYMKNLIVTDVKNQPQEPKLEIACKLGIKSIEYFKQIMNVLTEDKDAEHNQQYYRSMINSRFNIAKTYSKMVSRTKDVRVQYMKSALNNYQALLDYVHKEVPTELADKFTQEVQLTKEMLAMMPKKIDKISYGCIQPTE